MSSSNVSTCVAPFPPGLESELIGDNPTRGLVDQAERDMRAAAMVSIEGIQKLVDSLDSIEDRDAVVDAVRKDVLTDVQERVNKKADQLWEKGKHMLAARQTKDKERNQLLAEQIAECHKRQHMLEEENQRLKNVLADFTSRLATFGFVLNHAQNGSPQTLGGAKATTTNGNAADLSTKASTTCSTPPSERVYSPATGTPGGDSTSKIPDFGPPPSLPEVPDFPFPAALPTAVPGAPTPMAVSGMPTPFLLSEALGAHKPQRTPLSLAESLSTTSSTETPVSKVPFTFSFTLRIADNATLGLNVSHHPQDHVLRVEGVRPEGAMEAWNRQCAGSQFAEKAVLPGDHIISVNSVMNDPAKMLEECREKQLLKLTVVRNYVSATAAALATSETPTSKSTALRAEATVFVPMMSQTASDGAKDAEKAGEETAKAKASDGDEDGDTNV